MDFPTILKIAASIGTPNQKLEELRYVLDDDEISAILAAAEALIRTSLGKSAA